MTTRRQRQSLRTMEVSAINQKDPNEELMRKVADTL